MSKKADKEGHSSGSVFRYRSPTFTQAETKLLVQLVDKYKNPIINKSTNSSAIFVKDKAWVELAKEFNEGNTEYVRTADVLRTKWENLKRRFRNSSWNEDDAASDPFLHEISKSVIRICASDIGSILETNDEVSDSKEHKFNISTLDDDDDDYDNKGDVKGWGVVKEKSSDPIGGVNKKKEYAIAVMSPRDCRLLLHSVRQEKADLFSSSMANRHKAWNRVARIFNRRSQQKRSPAELKKKFQTLRTMVGRVNARTNGNHYEKIDEADIKKRKIKSEPKSDEQNDSSGPVEWSDNDAELDMNQGPASVMDANNDPLTSGVSSDSGLDSLNNSKNKEIDKLRVQLLNYEMETAKLQRKRIEESYAAEKQERDSRELEASLRLRAARLEVVAAEGKLPPLHPALRYTPEEGRAQQYMNMCLPPQYNGEDVNQTAAINM